MAVKRRIAATELPVEPIDANFSLKGRIYSSLKDAITGVEIYADDVKCAHGATVGQLDEAALFYIVSRGVDPAAARRMLTQAFAAEVLETIKPPALQTYLAARVSGQLSPAVPTDTVR